MLVKPEQIILQVGIEGMGKELQACKIHTKVIELQLNHGISPLFWDLYLTANKTLGHDG